MRISFKLKNSKKIVDLKVKQQKINNKVVSLDINEVRVSKKIWHIKNLGDRGFFNKKAIKFKIQIIVLVIQKHLIKMKCLSDKKEF